MPSWAVQGMKYARAGGLLAAALGCGDDALHAYWAHDKDNVLQAWMDGRYGFLTGGAPGRGTAGVTGRWVAKVRAARGPLPRRVAGADFAASGGMRAGGGEMKRWMQRGVREGMMGWNGYLTLGYGDDGCCLCASYVEECHMLSAVFTRKCVAASGEFVLVPSVISEPVGTFGRGGEQ